MQWNPRPFRPSMRRKKKRRLRRRRCEGGIRERGTLWVSRISLLVNPRTGKTHRGLANKVVAYTTFTTTLCGGTLLLIKLITFNRNISFHRSDLITRVKKYTCNSKIFTCIMQSFSTMIIKLLLRINCIKVYCSQLHKWINIQKDAYKHRWYS